MAKKRKRKTHKRKSRRISGFSGSIGKSTTSMTRGRVGKYLPSFFAGMAGAFIKSKLPPSLGWLGSPMGMIVLGEIFNFPGVAHAGAGMLGIEMGKNVGLYGPMDTGYLGNSLSNMDLSAIERDITNRSQIISGAGNDEYQRSSSL